MDITGNLVTAPAGWRARYRDEVTGTEVCLPLVGWLAEAYGNWRPVVWSDEDGYLRDAESAAPGFSGLTGPRA